jgi:hypothetical protein
VVTQCGLPRVGQLVAIDPQLDLHVGEPTCASADAAEWTRPQRYSPKNDVTSKQSLGKSRTSSATTTQRTTTTEQFPWEMTGLWWGPMMCAIWWTSRAPITASWIDSLVFSARNPATVERTVTG